MQPGTNTTSNFSFGTAPASSATGTPVFSFGKPGGTSAGFSFNNVGGNPASTPVVGATTAPTAGTGTFGSTPSSSMFGSMPSSTPMFGSHVHQSTGQSTTLFSGLTTTAGQMSGGSLFSARLPTTATSTQSATMFSGSTAFSSQPTGMTFGAKQQTTTTGGTPSIGFFSGKVPANLGSVTASFGASPATMTPSFGAPSGTVTPSFGAMPGTVTPSFGATPATVTRSFGETPATVTPSFGATPGKVTPSFGGTPAMVPPSFKANQPTTTAGGIVGFSGFAPPKSSGISFGTPTQTSIAPGTQGIGQALGTKPTQTVSAATTGFSFATSTTTTSSTGTTAQTTGLAMPKFGTTTATSGFSFGNSSSGFKLGSTGTTQTGLTPGNISATLATPTTSSFKLATTLSTTQQATTQPVQGLSLGQSSTGFNLTKQLGGQTKTTGSATDTITQPTVAFPAVKFGVTEKSTIPSMTPSFTTTTSAAKPALGLSIPQTSTTSSLGFSGLKPQTTVAPTTAAATTAAAATSGTSSTEERSEKYTYKQLEDQVNKWNIELEELEKAFLEQAAEVNMADRQLMENGEKIIVLHNEVERAKSEQDRLDQELDFLVAQQNELEDLLKPLEDSVKQHSTEYALEPDREREKIYAMAEKCDGQLKGMVQDLKEIIDYLNSTNASHQQEDNPVIQIAKILNVHMDSLQWIDQNSVLLQKRVDEIARLGDLRRREYDRSFRLGFD